MSDEGELGGRWSSRPAGSTSDDETTDRSTAPIPQVNTEPKPPEAGPGAQAYGAAAPPVNDRSRPAFEEPAAIPTATPTPAAEPVREAGPSQAGPSQAGPWERQLFDGDHGPGDPRYAPVTPSGPSTPPKPGTPSSGNLRLPEWMREEMNGGRDKTPGPGPSGGTNPWGPDGEEDEGRSRLMLYGGVGLLVVALLAAAAVYFLKSSGSDGTSGGTDEGNRPAGATSPSAQAPDVKVPADKPLISFRGRHSRAVGVLPDRLAGVAYPRLGAPWGIPTAKSGLGKLGWSGQQVVVTEERGGRPTWYGQLLSGTLSAAQRDLYSGPGTERAAAAALAKEYEARFYAFPHKTRDLASQRLTVDGHKGWLIGSYIGYHKPGIKSTAEVMALAVVDTGRASPAVIFMALPNTNRNLWPDFNYVFGSLKVTS
ncbi:MAG TPA: hypothetical protein VH912_14005 [Streptosporangiaceae bacterium]|jgi:hypothetical protein